LQGIKTSLEEVGSDFLLLQEVQGDHRNEYLKKLNWVSEAQFEYIADKVWGHYAYAKNAVYDQGHHGNAILSKYPIVHWHNVNFSKIKFCSRSVLHAVVQIPTIDRQLHVMCAHFGLRSSERMRNLNTLEQYFFAQELFNEPVVLAGDFNDWRGELSSKVAARMGLSEATWSQNGQHVKTFPSSFPILPLDRVYTRGVHLNRVEVLHGHPWHRLSDHLPILFDVELSREDSIIPL
jgi:endonuclease/exonuclease/phosphatase family metal-dependent hydrolase